MGWGDSDGWKVNSRFSAFRCFFAALRWREEGVEEDGDSIGEAPHSIIRLQTVAKFERKNVER